MIDTERLTLRGWTDADKAPFHAMCNDPDVMEYLGEYMTRAEVEFATARQNGFLGELGYCFWALERKEDGAFLGFCGIKPGAHGTPIEGQVEIGWRLASAYWGQGYAREAAQASLDWAWENIAADSVWAIANSGNARSWGLMERLGMQHRPELDFGHSQREIEAGAIAHVTYSIERPQ